MVLVFIVLNSKTLLRFSTLLYEIWETGFLWATTVWFSVWTKPENRLAAAAAAAKSLQLCLTLCNPIDSSPPGSPIPGILQARILEWVSISFSNAWKWKVKVKSLSCARLLATPWAGAYQAPPSTGFSRQEYWSVCHCLLRPLIPTCSNYFSVFFN